VNISDPIRRHARIAPHAPAILHFGETLTYAQFNAVIDSLATRMLGQGLMQGQAAGVMLSNSYAQLAFTLALARIGAVAVTSRDVVRGVGGIKVQASFVDETSAQGIDNIILVDETWARAPARTVATQIRGVPMHPGGKALCMVVSSSGTTGVPKAIPLTHDLLRARIHAKWLAFRAPDKARQICALGLESYYGMSSVLRTLWSGGMVATAIRWDDIPVAIPLHRIDYLVLSPLQLGRLLQSFPAGAGPFECLRTLEVGGSSVPPRLAAQARAQLCNNIQNAYGAAELGYVAGAGMEILEQRPGAIGYVAPGIEVQAVDDEHRLLAPGSEGTLRIRSATCIDAYLNDPEASAIAFRDGWFYPGDVGAVGDDGLLSVAGRKGEMINAGGVKASPRDIENVLLQNPDVAEAAAFAMNNPGTGVDEIWVAIVQKKHISMEVLHRHSIDKLGQRAPRSILVVESLPRNERGKVLQDELVRMAASASAGKPAAGTNRRP